MKNKMGEDECSRRSLPGDVIGKILSKLDGKTLIEYSSEYPDDDNLRRITSLEITMPASEFQWEPILGERLTRFMNRLFFRAFESFNLITVNIPKFIQKIIVLVVYEIVVDVVNNLVLTVRVEKIFQRRLTGLKTLHLQIPDLPYAVCPPNLWFRWDAKFGVQGSWDYVVYVFGDIVGTIDDEVEIEEQIEEEIEEIEEEEFENAIPDISFLAIKRKIARNPNILAFLYFAARLMHVHLRMCCLKYDSTRTWKKDMSVTTRDVGRNGGLVMGTGWGYSSGQGQFRIKSYLLKNPKTLVHHGSTLVRIRNLTLMFAGYDTDITHDHSIGMRTDDELVMAWLGTSDEKREPIEKRELRRVVAYMLDHPDCKEW